MSSRAPRSDSRRWWLLALGGVGAAALAFARFGRMAAGQGGSFVRGPGRFDRGAMEAIVDEVRRRAIPRGEERRYRLRDVATPGSLVELAPDAAIARGAGRGVVHARVTPAGALQVVVETVDLGHAGEYGFAFSDVPLRATPMGGDGDWYTLDVPSRLSITSPDRRIDAHWWSVLYNLD